MKRAKQATPIKVMHVVYSFHMGGLENVVTQLINRLPRDQYQHCLVSLTDMGEFVQRIERDDITLISLNKGPGHAIPLYPTVMKHLRSFRPDVLHTCNLAALEMTPLAWLAGVPIRVHAEHGWDVQDPRGDNVKLQSLRRFYRLFVSRYIAVSADLDSYLKHRVGIPDRRRALIANGVDTERFAPRTAAYNVPGDCPFRLGEHWVMGTVGRMQTVKNQPLLARAFVRLLEKHPSTREKARLVMVGDGPLRAEVEGILQAGQARDLAWLPGARSDVAELMRAFDCFVLPSDTEGTSCTLQEAMACGLPTVATAVGGTPELIEDGATGRLVPPRDVDAMADALWAYFVSPATAAAHGASAREIAVSRHGLDAMVSRYDRLFKGS